MPAERPLRILTWNVHGNYLHALAHVPHEWLVPVAGMRPGYTPPTPELDWPAHVRVVDPGQLRDETLDLIVYQSRDNLADAPQLLRPAQLALPSLYVEHNPPEPHPTDSWHPFRHPRGLLLHVTHHNAQMWQAPGMPARVIEHGVPDPGIIDAGSREGGITVINHLARRGRRLGLDLYRRAHARLALDLIGMGSRELPGGLGEVPNREVPAFMARYRYLFSPVRYASLGLSVVQAMLCGLPVVGFAATELACLIRNGEDGYVDSREQGWLEAAHALAQDPALARRWGEAARRKALGRFGMARFIAEWDETLHALKEQA